MTKYRGVEGGTTYGDPLCRTCSNAQYIRGKSLGQMELHCHALSSYENKISFEAYECSSYEDKRLPDLHDMRRTAWIIQSDAMTKRIGFIAPGTKQHETICEDERIRSPFDD